MSNFADKLNKLKTLLVKASEHRSYVRQIYEIIQHKVVINVNPLDYYRHEFYKNGETLEQKSRYVILGGSRYWPFENNAFKFAVTLNNKYIQKTLLKGFGLPTPEVLTTIGIDYDIKDRDQLENFLGENQRDIVFKPISSAQGKNILVVTKRDNQYFLGEQPITYDDIWNHVKRDMKNGYLFEEKVVNHSSIADINPSCLNTSRVITIKTNDNKWHIAVCIAKFGRAGSFVDNASAGGIVLWPDNMGKIIDAYDFLTREPIIHHPDTGARLTGIELAGYQQVNELALQASEKFCFMGAIGWDIAYTDNGAMIIEGNSISGVDKIQIGKGGMIGDEIAKGLKRHYMLGRWDKTKMYPGYWRKPWWSRKK